MNILYAPATGTVTFGNVTEASGRPPMLRTLSPPEHDPQLVRPVLPNEFAESSASRTNTRSAGLVRTGTVPDTLRAELSSWNDAVTGMLTEPTSCPAGEVAVQVPSSSPARRIDGRVAGAPVSVHPAGNTGASDTLSIWSSASSRSRAVIFTACWPG